MSVQSVIEVNIENMLIGHLETRIFERLVKYPG